MKDRSLWPRYQFGNVVVVEDNQIGVIVKTWGASHIRPIHYDVYVRSYNGIKEYDENQVSHYIYNKEIADDKTEFYQ